MIKSFLEPQTIIGTVAEFCHVPVDLIKGRNRKREIVKARHLSMYFIDTFADGSLNEKGKLFGKDHDDIIYARHSVTNQAKIYKAYRTEVFKIKDSLLGKIDLEFERYKDFNIENV